MSKFINAVVFGLTIVLCSSSVSQAALINTYAPSNITVTVSDELSIGLKGDMINGNGFGGSAPNFTDADLDTVPEHSNSNPIANDMWLDTAGTPANAWAAFDLGAVYTLDFMRVWNYNQAGATGRGVNSAKIYYSSLTSPGLPTGDALNPAVSGWTQLGSGSFIFTQASGANTYDAVNNIGFGSISVRHVLIDIESNHGLGTNVGLSELQFFSAPVQVPAPEPSTLVLLATAACVLTRFRRQR